MHPSLQERVSTVAIVNLSENDKTDPAVFIAEVLEVAVASFDESKPEWDRARRIRAIEYAEGEVRARLHGVVLDLHQIACDTRPATDARAARKARMEARAALLRTHLAAVKAKQVSQHWLEA